MSSLTPILLLPKFGARTLRRRVSAMMLTAAALWASGSSLANTVLFIDLNNAAPEIAAVKAAMPKARDGSASRLIVVPSQRRFTPQHRAEILSVKQRFNTLHERALDCTTHAGPKHCLPIWTALQALEVERTKLTGDYGLKELSEDIRAEFGNNRVAADLVIISGHHSSGYFAGEIARLDMVDLMTLDLQFPDLLRHARSVLLLGCDTGTQSMLTEHFMPIFPAARLIIGADSPAPVRDNAANLRFIRAAVGAEERLANAPNAAEAKRRYSELRKQHWPVAIFWQQRHYFSRELSVDTSEARGAKPASLLALRTAPQAQ